MICSSVMADNAVMNYLKKWVDETRVEKAIGNLLYEQFASDIPKEFSIEEDKALTAKFIGFIEKCGAKSEVALGCKVMMLKSDIPDEILLPGGILIITNGYWQYASNQEQKDFILARNAFLAFQKQPLAVIKHEGLYPKCLDYIKLDEKKRSDTDVRDLVRAYLTIVSKMNHKKADVQGALLTVTPEKTRIGAIEMLSRFSVRVWPPFPFDTIDLPSRITELKNIKLPEQKL